MKYVFFILFILLSFSYTSYAQEEKEGSVQEDWEKELEADIESTDKDSKSLQDSRGSTSVLPTGNSINRSAQNLMMNISTAVDIVGEWDKQKPQVSNNQLDVRSAEFGFSGAVDQWLRGNLLIAAHGENGEYFFEIHEAWVQFPFLPYNLSLKAGSFFLDLGRLNRIHQHDRPFTTTPIVHEKFIDTESIADTGLELSILFPWTFLSQELVIGGTNGKKWGHSHDGGIKKNNPLAYAHLKNFYYFGNNLGTQFGFTASRFEPTENKKNEKFLYGFDIVVRWNYSNLREFILMAEAWYNKEVFPENEIQYHPESKTISPEPNYYPYPGKPANQIQWGQYIFLNYKFHQLWSAGFRYDFFTDYSLKNQAGYMATNAIEAQSFQISFIPSEFSFIRATVERRFTMDYSGETPENKALQGLIITPDFEKVEYRFFVQAVFILGSHPAHQY